MKTSRLTTVLALFLALSCSRGPKDGEYLLTVLSTNDVHSTWFDSTYVGGRLRKSLFAMNHYIDSVRRAEGPENVLLVDAGDCLQGDNAAYYYNYVDTLSPHLFPRLMAYMKYDAVAVGNHDIETGHKVYDRVTRDLKAGGADFLAGNALVNGSGKTYFPLYKMVKKAGLRIAVLGYTNANMKAWLNESLWSGMHFVPIADIIQADVDYVRKKEHPDVVVATMHSACGQGDGSVLEAEALDALNHTRGIDFLVCGHDHRPYVETRDTCALLNSGSHSRYVAIGKLHLTIEGGKAVQKCFETGLIPVKASDADSLMRAHFRKEFEAVRAFTLQEVGVLNTPIRTRDAYRGMCPYMNLLHTLALNSEGTEISFAAPLTYNGFVDSGVLVYNDMFTIYPFENQLYIVRLTGNEIQRYLEVSYDKWINTVSGPGDHLLKITPREDARNQQRGWSFENRAYNFDSAAGLHYTIDVTKPFGARVTILSMADGSAFEPGRTYSVAMTSYRASGGGDLLRLAGIDTDSLEERTVSRLPEIRNILYSYLVEHGSIDPEVIGDPAVIGSWKFIPEKLAATLLDKDMGLLFGK